MNLPNLPLAAPQRGNQPGTWAHHTIKTRFPNIARRILVENRFSQEIESRVLKLLGQIPETPIRLLSDPGAEDQDAWNGHIQPFEGDDWHQPPWWFTEHYFYRRILEATRYFQGGSGGGVDPFGYQKRRGLEVSQDAIQHLSAWLEGMPSSPQVSIVERLLQLDLWGNQADLSMWRCLQIQ